jgi:hypothetical protein
VVSNALGAESADLTLVLDGALPVIVNPPQSLSVAPGDGFQLAVAVTGPEPLSYQWFKDSALLPFDTASTLYRWGAAAADTGLYRVRVSNPNGEIWSAPVTVSVGGGVPLGEAVEAPLRAWSTVNGCVGGAAWLGVTNVTHDGVDAAGSVPLSNDQVCTLDLQTEVAGPLTLGFWWKLQGAVADELRVDVRDASLNVVASAARNGADGNGWTNVKVSVPAGTNSIRWRLSSGDAFDGVLPQAWVDQVVLRSLAEALDTDGLVWTTGSTDPISGNPADGWFYETATTSDGVDAAQSQGVRALGRSWLETTIGGPAVLECQWFLAGDADAQLEFTLDGGAVPFGTISGSMGPTNFHTGDFLIPPGAHVARWELQAGNQLTTAAIAWLDQARLLPGQTDLGVALDNSAVVWVGPGWTADANLVFIGGSAAKSPAIPDNSHATLDTAVVGPAAVQFAWRVDAQAGDYLRFYVDELKYDEITGSTGFPFREVLTTVGPGVHYLRWAYEKDASGAAGADAGWVDNVRITLLDKPFITYEPVDATATEGQSAGFTVLAVGPEPITYQWYHSAPLAGQTNYWLQLASAQLGDAGNYFVVLSNSFGSTTSRVAQLVVNGIPPVFTNSLLPRWVYPREAIHFEVGATGPRPLTYIWQFSTNGFATTNVIKTGSATTYDIASAGYEHSGTWRVLALDAASGASAASSAKLVVGSGFYHLYALTNGIPTASDALARGMYGGTVVGVVYQGGYPNDPRAYLFNRYGATALEHTTNGVFSMANAMNSDGVVVGSAMGPTGRARAVRWKPVGYACPPWPVSCLEMPPCGNEPPEDLGIPPGFADTQFEAVAINDRGQIVVNANMQTVAAHYALRWQDGNWQGLQDPEWSGGENQGWTVSVGINSLGYIAGYSAGATWDSFAHAWVFDPHNEPDSPSGALRATDLHERYNFDAAGFGYSATTGLNHWGEVVGVRKPSRHYGTASAFVITRQGLIDLDIYGVSGDLQVNGSGEIITYDSSSRPMVIRDDGLFTCANCLASGGSYGHQRAFLLEDLVLGGIGPFSELVHVSAIDDLGDIAGHGIIPGLGSQGYRPFLLVPASAPGNHPPVAVDDTVTRFTDRVMVSASQRLLRNDYDPDPNEALSLVYYSTRTTNGGTVFLQGDWLTYAPTNGFTGEDHFNYTITDNRGGLASANVIIRPESPRVVPPLNHFLVLQEPGTVPVLRYTGTPGVTYRIEGSDTFAPGSWQTVAVLTARTDGTLDMLDPSTILHPRRFYRAVTQ